MTRLRLWLGGCLLLLFGLSAALPLLAVSHGFICFGSLTSTALREAPLLLLGGDGQLHGGASAPVLVVGGTLHLSGKVTDVVVGVDADIVVGPRAVLTADVVDLGGHIYRAPGVQVSGNIVGVTSPWSQHASRQAGLLHDAQLAALASLSVFVLALLLSAAFPWRVLVVAATVRRYSWQSLIVAVAGMAGLPLLCLPLLLSLIGLPLALLLALAAMGLWLTGLAGAGLLIGHRLLAACGTADSLLRSTFLGLLVLSLVGLIPGYGLLLLVGLGSLGAGATVLSLIDRSRAVRLSLTSHSWQR